jgi:glutamine amidotransferase
MITIISYGSGNINAFVNIYQKLGFDIKVAKNEKDLENIEKILIPGVGSFDETINKINQSGMREKIDFYVLRKKIPVLGICVGMQIMGYSSEEGSMEGLGWIPGKIRKLPKEKCLKLPHMGWNLLKIKKNHKLFSNVEDESRFYFLHSYFFDTDNHENILSETNYNFNFASSIYNNNIYGIQFHPEKSHKAGYQLLKNFAEL